MKNPNKCKHEWSKAKLGMHYIKYQRSDKWMRKHGITLRTGEFRYCQKCGIIRMSKKLMEQDVDYPRRRKVIG